MSLGVIFSRLSGRAWGQHRDSLPRQGKERATTDLLVAGPGVGWISRGGGGWLEGRMVGSDDLIFVFSTHRQPSADHPRFPTMRFDP